MLRTLVTWVALSVMLDRVVISVGLNAITESQIKEELAVTAFLNREPVSDSLTERRAAAHRLVQQALISRDMELARFPKANVSQAQRETDRIVDEYGGAAGFETSLTRYRLTSAVLRQHIENQLATLRFIEYRFRPELTISESELHAEYDRRADNWKRQHPSSTRPGFEESRASLRSDLSEERTDQALDDWLKQTASQTRVVYLDPSLRPPE